MFRICRQTPLLLLAALASNLASAADSCDDKRLKESLKPELNLETVEADCDRSARAQAPYGKVTIKNREGRDMNLSCCGASRILAFEGAEKMLELKRGVCEDAVRRAPNGACGGAHCLTNMGQYYDSLESNYSELAKKVSDHAKEVKRVRAECRQAYAKFAQTIPRDRQQVERRTASLPPEKREEALDRNTLGRSP